MYFFDLQNMYFSDFETCDDRGKWIEYMSAIFICISLIYKTYICLIQKHVFLCCAFKFSREAFSNCDDRGKWIEYMSAIFICISLIYKTYICLIQKHVFLCCAFKFSREAFSNCDDRGKWSGRGMTGADD